MVLDRNYQLAIAEKWSKVLDAGEGIKNENVRIATAMVLENAQSDADRQQMVREATVPAGAMMAAPAGAFGDYSGANAFGTSDARIPSIVIPMLRRIFPELIGHEIVGVQPMNAPVGFAFALRSNYGTAGQFQSDLGSHEVASGTELGYNNLDTTFTGASGAAPTPTAMWQAYAGAANTSLYGGETHVAGQGASLLASEWAALGTDMPTANFELKKAVVEAKTRKLGASWPRELAEDMMNMHGIDADSEMVNIISYEIQAEIDRELISECVRAAITEGRTSTWSPVSADGRNQIERIGTLYTHMLDKSGDIAIYTRRGSGNFAVASPKVCALLQRVSQSVSVNTGVAGIPAVQAGTGSVERVGRIGDSHALYRDTFAGGNYLMVGYKGQMTYDSGVIYCPYIPLQVARTTGENDFNPRMSVRTRDGIIGSQGGRPDGFAAGNYYQFIKIDDLTNVALAADGGRIFTFN
jgi:hypothetical protein